MSMLQVSIYLHLPRLLPQYMYIIYIVWSYKEMMVFILYDLCDVCLCLNNMV